MVVPPGSSPLARGLRSARPAPSTGRRIIPARAGFTGRAGRRTAAPPDHPRSRGVYRRRRPPDDRGEGSSPLARGLQRGECGPSAHGRIIPARAGFTQHHPQHNPRRGDHPRSRGVYTKCWPGWASRRGSSPLARGLRRGGMRRRCRMGIIPARAGFTDGRSADPCGCEDHPRSRGVYDRRPRSRGAVRGSSPLARGLPVRLLRELSVAGDHPRSRGVYEARRVGRVPDPGSSPLARGLRAGGRRVRGGVGIIPARAGFTGRGVDRRARGEDHPRSRGVYTGPACAP